MRKGIAALALVFLAAHLPFLPPTLEDLDSINFALGVRHYDISQHQPHPPGYPLFVGGAKVLSAVGFSEVHALSLLGASGGLLEGPLTGLRIALALPVIAALLTLGAAAAAVVQWRRGLGNGDRIR